MPDDVKRWLDELSLGEYADAFAKNYIDASLLPDLTNEDLKDIGVVAVGHRRKLLDAIAALSKREDAASGSLAFGAHPLDEPRPEAERRQLTVMFSDLVGSTELSQRLDPEDLRELMQAYQHIVAATVERYEGHVAKFLGDGVLCYFGWPHAFEDDAGQAVRAGLDILKAIESGVFPDDTTLRTRIGIATGEVVVGDLEGQNSLEPDAIWGKTPNLAARLQSATEPQTLLIDHTTQRLLGASFVLESIGPLELKGFAEPVPAWRVQRENKAQSRFEAAHGDTLIAQAGRDHELAQLLELWRVAKNGKGQVAGLSGEAGIGKSRMLQTLRDKIGRIPYYCLRYQCSPHHTNSAFYPIIQRLEQAAGFTSGEDTESRLDKLEALLRLSSSNIDNDVSLFAALLSLAYEHRYSALQLTPKQQRDLTLEALIRQLLALSRQRPVLLLLEDAHWIDPTTEALIGETLLRIGAAPVLMVITYRPEYQPPWADLPNLTTIVLGRLPDPHCGQIVRAMAANKLTDAVIAQIIARANGVPLFAEELTKSMLESGADKTDDIDDIPASLQALLIARLDRLGEAAALARQAATLGRSFHYHLIRAVSGLDEGKLGRALIAMTAAGLLLQHGAPPQATYSFKHTLIQEATYDTLLKGKRRQYHGKVAEVLLRDFSEQAGNEPELLARHLSLARLPEKAVEYWLRAGQRAGEQSAHIEAIANLENGLRELERIPESRSRDAREFDLRIALGASLLSVKGWSAPQVAKNYERAQALVAKGGDVRKLFAALRGLANVFLLRGEVAKTREVADRLLAIAQDENDNALLLEAYRSVGMCAFFAGDFPTALEHLQRANAIYDRKQHHSHAFVYGTDPYVVGRSVGAWGRWFVGDTENAISDINAALRLAGELQHPFSLAYATSLAAALYQVCHDPEAVYRHAGEAIAIAEAHDYPYWLGWATMMRGWAVAALGDVDEGIAMLKAGLTTYESTGALQIKPYILTLLAEMYGWAGSPQKGLEVLAGAIGAGRQSDVRFYEAESLRIQGELLRRAQAGDGRKQFARAVSLARRQGARALELRAARSAQS